LQEISELILLLIDRFDPHKNNKELHQVHVDEDFA